MHTERVEDPRAFQDFLAARLAHGPDGLTLTDYLDLWAHENETDQERQETLEAIRRGFADVEAGRVRPAREAINEIRRKHHLPDLP